MALGPSSGEGPAADSAAALFESVPLFPLPNVVLFPRAVLPLHIFEERYKAMTADALDGSPKCLRAYLDARQLCAPVKYSYATMRRTASTAATVTGLSDTTYRRDARV